MSKSNKTKGSSNNLFLVINSCFFFCIFHFLNNRASLDRERRSMQAILDSLVHNGPELETVELPGDGLGGSNQASPQGTALHLRVLFGAFEACVACAAAPLQTAVETIECQLN
jgi:hypothetical protein